MAVYSRCMPEKLERLAPVEPTPVMKDPVPGIPPEQFIRTLPGEDNFDIPGCFLRNEECRDHSGVSQRLVIGPSNSRQGTDDIGLLNENFRVIRRHPFRRNSRPG